MDYVYSGDEQLEIDLGRLSPKPSLWILLTDSGIALNSLASKTAIVPGRFFWQVDLERRPLTNLKGDLTPERLRNGSGLARNLGMKSMEA